MYYDDMKKMFDVRFLKPFPEVVRMLKSEDFQNLCKAEIFIHNHIPALWIY